MSILLDEYTRVRRRIWDSLVQKVMPLRDKKIIGAIPEDLLPQRRRLLDIGCGNGRLSGLLAERFSISLVGVDTEMKAVSFPFVRGRAEKLPFKPNNFDIVTAFSVIEHVPKQRRAKLLRECHRVLSENGVLIVQQPNRRYPIDQHTFVPFLGYLPARAQTALFGSYCDLPSIAELTELLVSADFENIRVIGYRFPMTNEIGWTKLVSRIPMDFGHLAISRRARHHGNGKTNHS